MIVIRGYGFYDMSGEFDDIIKANPIDNSYEKELNDMLSGDWRTRTWVELEDKYIQIWDNELNASCWRLMSYLSKEEQDALNESQLGWLQYRLKNYFCR